MECTNRLQQRLGFLSPRFTLRTTGDVIKPLNGKLRTPRVEPNYVVAPHVGCTKAQTFETEATEWMQNDTRECCWRRSTRGFVLCRATFAARADRQFAQNDQHQCPPRL